MHLYCWDSQRLERILVKFAEGQFLMETKEGLVFRGEISNCLVPDNRNKKVLISFCWLSERRSVLNNWGKPLQKWVLLEPSIGPLRLDVGFTTYYSQPDEDRLKMWGSFGEVCHFFRKGDHTNLVKHGDEIVPYCQIHQLQFCQAIIALSSPKRQCPLRMA